MSSNEASVELDAELLSRWHRFRGTHHPFTIPGHQGLAGRLDATLGALLDSDVPLYGGLDSVKLSADRLAAAERRAADAWGADWARFSTGGSTHGNQAMTLAVGKPGDTVLVARTAHRSTLLGLVLAGLTPVWLPVSTDARWGTPAGVEAGALQDALEVHSPVAVFLTEPAYLGVTSDLPTLIALSHRSEVPVIVDQAWGAHFGWAAGYPEQAVKLGADAVVMSAHKTLPAYSQACLIVARTTRLDRDRLDRAVDACHTTSPAGSILASIDASRALLESRGAMLLGQLAERVRAARTRLRALPGVQVPGPEDFPVGRFDPAKLVVIVAGAGVDGIAVEQDLLRDGIPVELADRDMLVPIVTMVDTAADLEPLLGALERSIRAHTTGAARPVRAAPLPDTDQALTPREAFFADQIAVPAAAAAGRVCAEVVAPYPPGVPVLMPGEVITTEIVHWLQTLARRGTRVAYAADPTLQTFRIVK